MGAESKRGAAWSAEAVEQMRAGRAQGLRQWQIAEALGVSQTTVSAVMRALGLETGRPANASRRSPPLSTVTTELVRGLREEGLSRREIGARLGLTPAQVRSATAPAVPKPPSARRPHITPAEDARMAQLYAAGLTVAAIAAQFGRCEDVVRDHLNAAGVKLRAPRLMITPRDDFAIEASARAMLEDRSSKGDVYRWLRARGRAGGTDDQIEEGLGVRHETVSARRNDLVKMGLVEDSGERRPTRRDCDARVWVVVEPGTGVPALSRGMHRRPKLTREQAEREARILEALRATGGATDDELAARTGYTRPAVVERRYEMFMRGEVYSDGDMRPTRPDGKDALVWRAAPAEEAKRERSA